MDWPICRPHRNPIPTRNKLRQSRKKFPAPRIKLPRNLTDFRFQWHEHLARRFRQSTEQHPNLLLSQPGNHPLQLPRRQVCRHRQRHPHGHPIRFFTRAIRVSHRKRSLPHRHLVGKKCPIIGSFIVPNQILLRRTKKVGIRIQTITNQPIQIMHR